MTNQPPPLDVGAVARRLSKAQRAAIVASRPDIVSGLRTAVYLPSYRDRGVLVKSIVDAGLATPTLIGVKLNRGGLAVRAHLLATLPKGSDDAR